MCVSQYFSISFHVSIDFQFANASTSTIHFDSINDEMAIIEHDFRRSCQISDNDFNEFNNIFIGFIGKCLS